MPPAQLCVHLLAVGLLLISQVRKLAPPEVLEILESSKEGMERVRARCVRDGLEGWRRDYESGANLSDELDCPQKWAQRRGASIPPSTLGQLDCF